MCPKNLINLTKIRILVRGNYLVKKQFSRITNPKKTLHTSLVISPDLYVIDDQTCQVWSSFDQISGQFD